MSKQPDNLKWWQIPGLALLGLGRLIVAVWDRRPWNTENRG